LLEDGGAVTLLLRSPSFLTRIWLFYRNMLKKPAFVAAAIVSLLTSLFFSFVFTSAELPEWFPWLTTVVFATTSAVMALRVAMISVPPQTIVFDRGALRHSVHGFTSTQPWTWVAEAREDAVFLVIRLGEPSKLEIFVDKRKVAGPIVDRLAELLRDQVPARAALMPRAAERRDTRAQP
jgi:hypothetical protein